MSLGLRMLVLILALAGACLVQAKPGRVTVSPGLTDLSLSPHMTYLVDPEGRADASSMFQAAAQDRFKPLPNGNATFGFGDGAYWFH
ncbi:MAG: hypothetical protein H7147_11995, partial [Frankiaceae bacterium]|nr:hypothetical protein [Arenimonas sp.]